MLFTRLALFALTSVGALASPVAPAKANQLSKRGPILDIVTTLQSSIKAPITSINEGNTAKTLTADDAQVYLNDILNSINVASGALSGNAIGIDVKKRSLAGVAEALQVAKRQGTADDLNEVGAVLAEIIKDIVTAVEGLADDLKKLPLVGALIISIDSGLNTLLLGLQILLAGVIEVVQGLLAGLSGLLGSLGFGLLFGLLFP